MPHIRSYAAMLAVLSVLGVGSMVRAAEVDYKLTVAGEQSFDMVYVPDQATPWEMLFYTLTQGVANAGQTNMFAEPGLGNPSHITFGQILDQADPTGPYRIIYDILAYVPTLGYVDPVLPRSGIVNGSSQFGANAEFIPITLPSGGGFEDAATNNVAPAIPIFFVPEVPEPASLALLGLGALALLGRRRTTAR